MTLPRAEGALRDIRIPLGSFGGFSGFGIGATASATDVVPTSEADFDHDNRQPCVLKVCADSGLRHTIGGRDISPRILF